jgi:hypothetical protein
MKLENQVCRFELAKKLKALGVKQESLWWWVPCLEGTSTEAYHFTGEHYFTGEYKIASDLMSTYLRTKTNKSDYSAFTVAELGEMLPEKRYDDDMWKQIWEWEEKGLTEANARAKVLEHRLLQQEASP